ncbi:hypothetical protein TNCV_3503581 [Trichonephila clavipes]|uniref:Uncharacterized protein n=1 Tax=Trichonephila clavipes TaxID=2585209 RepID=A0A8X6RVB1_TRICX|nr:hypothetical protein TNCV_3503581 [Trichonephila clavipes]
MLWQGCIQGSEAGFAANVDDTPDEGGVQESWEMLGRRRWGKGARDVESVWTDSENPFYYWSKSPFTRCTLKPAVGVGTALVTLLSVKSRTVRG